MLYIETETLIPVTENVIRENHPNWVVNLETAAPEALAANGYARAYYAPIPVVDWDQKVTPGEFVLQENGEYIQSWSIVDMTPEESALKLTNTISNLHTEVDRKADSYLVLVGSPGEFRGTEYDEKYNEALIYQGNADHFDEQTPTSEEDPTPVGEVRLIENLPNIYYHRGGPDGNTAAEVAATYISRATPWKHLHAMVNAVRVKGKATISLATTPAQAKEAKDAIDWSEVEAKIASMI